MIAVDLDGTLARYDGKYMAGKIGEPIPAMVERVKQWLSEGRPVCIYTARVSAIFRCASTDAQVEEAMLERTAIQEWCQVHIGEVLPITALKDYSMREFWDDRARQVEFNTGRLIADWFDESTEFTPEQWHYLARRLAERNATNAS